MNMTSRYFAGEDHFPFVMTAQAAFPVHGLRVGVALRKDLVLSMTDGTASRFCRLHPFFGTAKPSPATTKVRKRQTHMTIVGQTHRGSFPLHIFTLPVFLLKP